MRCEDVGIILLCSIISNCRDICGVGVNRQYVSDSSRGYLLRGSELFMTCCAAACRLMANGQCCGLFLSGACHPLGCLVLAGGALEVN